MKAFPGDQKAKNIADWRNTPFAAATRWYRSPSTSASKKTICCVEPAAGERHQTWANSDHPVGPEHALKAGAGQRSRVPMAPNPPSELIVLGAYSYAAGNCPQRTALLKTQRDHRALLCTSACWPSSRHIISTRVVLCGRPSAKRSA